MPPAPPSAALLLAAPAVIARLATLLAGLGALIARAFLRHPTHGTHLVPIWNYLNRTARRFQQVFVKAALGTLHPATPRPSRAGTGTPRPSPTRAFPATRAWLLSALRHEGAYFATQLTALLEQPETDALLRATPQARRLLRPICRYLGIMPAALEPPPRHRVRKPPLLPPAEPQRPAPSLLSADPAPAITEEPWNLATRAGTSPDPGESRLESPRPAPELCPRLRNRWPFNQLPAYAVA